MLVFFSQTYSHPPTPQQPFTQKSPPITLLPNHSMQHTPPNHPLNHLSDKCVLRICPARVFFILSVKKRLFQLIYPTSAAHRCLPLPAKSLSTPPHPRITHLPTHNKTSFNHLSDKYGNAILAPIGHCPNTLIVPPHHPTTPCNTRPNHPTHLHPQHTPTSRSPAPHKKKSRQFPVSSFLLQKIFANLA